jgi:DNA-directed RNA polymerase specialized sigma24 family protein
MKCPRAELARRPQPPAGSAVPAVTVRTADALAQLSDRHRAVMYLSLYLKLTTAQIAAELETDDRSVKQDLHEALHAVRRTLQNGGNSTH